MSTQNTGRIKHMILYILDYVMVFLSLVIPILKYYNIQFAFLPELQILTSALVVALLLLRSIMHYFLNEKHKRAKVENELLIREKTYTDIENNELKTYLESYRLPIEPVMVKAREIFQNTPKNTEPTETEPTVIISPYNENNTSPKSDTTNYERPINLTGFLQKLTNIVTRNNN